MNKATLNQLKCVILIDCISQCNEMKLNKEDYGRRLRAMLKSRFSETGQLELSV